MAAWAGEATGNMRSEHTIRSNVKTGRALHYTVLCDVAGGPAGRAGGAEPWRGGWNGRHGWRGLVLRGYLSRRYFRMTRSTRDSGSHVPVAPHLHAPPSYGVSSSSRSLS